MNDGDIIQQAYSPIAARLPVRIRQAIPEDLAFIDRMQKAQSRELGFLPTAALQGKITRQEVLIAELDSGAKPIAYLIAADRYLKRDEVGYVTQMCVLPEYRRSLVAAELLQAQFDRSAYGCKLYCCWCAQDLAANEFWESMGFSAIAFRTGSMTAGKSIDGKKSPRVHIFWQKRTRAGDNSTPWWYPSHTGGGELREDRLVFPIMPGIHWRDVTPIVLEPASQQALPEPKKKPRRKILRPPPHAHRGGIWFEHEAIVEKEPRAKKAKAHIDPRLKAISRQLRDQWSERSEQIVLSEAGKHDVKRIARTNPFAGAESLPCVQSLTRLSA